ncbi:uncharacterized protein CEXT_456531 [Caerostris extrusa]|uniref:Cuticle protein n=1 Tax=Caerostris extrusa TaxID=172846 RepID=A0AAV4Y1P6_CAEEX|nr:uncharacterized protein CEXT_456531 [Caerostris extrusa]
MRLIILTTLLAGTLAAPMQQSLNVNDDGSYQFFYETGKEAGNHKRREVRQPDGVVVGQFSYEGPGGEIREVNYRADDSGYVANGDVGVEGAPKGQFPAEPEQTDESHPEPSTSENETREPESFPVEETKSEDLKPEESKHNDEPVFHQEDPKEQRKHEDIKELPQEENSADEPPEAFPPGFFLQKFHSLRRLPEPTKEEESTTAESATEQPKEESPSTESSTSVEPSSEQPGQVLNAEDPYQVGLKAAHEMELFMHLRPFQSFSPQQMDTSMFHQPVYVFSYQHPDSYGYHYYF